MEKKQKHVQVQGTRDKNLRDGKKDAGSATEGTEEIASDGKKTNASTTEGRGSGNNPLQLLVHALLTMTSHNQSLFLELLGNIAGRRARNLNPSLREDSTSDQHVDEIDSGMDGIKESLRETEWRRHVVGDTGNGVQLSGARALTRLPGANETNKEVLAEAGVEHLADNEDVRGKSGLQHDRLYLNQ